MNDTPTVSHLKAEYAEAEAAWAAIPGDRPTQARQDAWKRVCDAYDALVAAGVKVETDADDSGYDFAARLDDQLCVPCILCNCQGCEHCLPYGKWTWADKTCACEVRD